MDQLSHFQMLLELNLEQNQPEHYLKEMVNKLLVLVFINNQTPILLRLQMELKTKLKKLDRDYLLEHR